MISRSSRAHLALSRARLSHSCRLRVHFRHWREHFLDTVPTTTTTRTRTSTPTLTPSLCCVRGIRYFGVTVPVAQTPNDRSATETNTLRAVQFLALTSHQPVSPTFDDFAASNTLSRVTLSPLSSAHHSRQWPSIYDPMNWLPTLHLPPTTSPTTHDPASIGVN
jgi:hypothetical protein